MNFTSEQIEKAKACNTLEEFKSLAKDEGLNLTDAEAEEYFNVTHKGELTDDELNAIAGGKGWVLEKSRMFYPQCPFCGAKLKVGVDTYKNSSGDYKFVLTRHNCVCGAQIYYATFTHNFSFKKDGQEREAKMWL